MAIRSASIKQNDAKRIFKAAIQAGFEKAKIIVHPDGRIEAQASFSETTPDPEGGNSWDDVLK